MTSLKTIEHILKVSGQILMVVGFFVFFIGLLASPVIYINIKQRHFFKKFTKKYHLKIEPYKHFVIRDFPYASGKINDKNVFIEATKLGKSYYNIHFDTYKYSSPVVILGVAYNNDAIQKIVLTQKIPVSSQIISKFDDYYTVEVKPEELKSTVFNDRTKQNIMNYSRKSQTYVNLFLDKGYLLSISNFELTNTKKYNTIVDKFTLMMSITNTK